VRTQAQRAPGIEEERVKKLLVAVAIVGTVTGSALAQGIDGSKHDFAGAAWNTSGSGTNQICSPCHTPHSAQSTQLIPLWNHTATTASFTLYTNSATLDATVDNTVSDVSKACLSCHDGTVALNAYGGSTANATKMATTAAAYVGTDLTDDHPVSFTYNDSLATTDGGLHAPSTTLSGITTGKHIDDDMLFGTGNDQLECASCHNPHNESGVAKLLLKSNANSALCLTCHDK